MLKEILESFKKLDLKPGYQVLINGKWYVIEEIEGDTIWVSDENGEEYEFKVRDVESIEKV
jgi:hypothetical protein